MLHMSNGMNIQSQHMKKLESIAQRTGAYLLYPSKFLCTKKDMQNP